MKSKTLISKTKRVNLAGVLARYPSAKEAVVPRGGWIAAMRDALEMSVAQLGRRLNLTAQSVREFETREHRGTLSLASLEKVAAGLNCRLVYALVPLDGTPEDTVYAQALKRVKAEFQSVDQTMKLEGQAYTPEQMKRLMDLHAQDLIRRGGRVFWR